MKKIGKFIQKEIGPGLFVIYDLQNQKYLLSKGKIGDNEIGKFFKKELGKEKNI